MSDDLGPQLRRGALVGLGAAGDIAINYPLWIIAKRVAAGLGWPAARDLYKGGGLLWLSLGPTFVCEDLCSRLLVPPATSAAARIGLALGSEGEAALAAAAAGAVAGIAVAAPIENVLTRAHKTGFSTRDAARDITRGGIISTMMPRGMAAMVGREVPFSLGLFFLKERVARHFHKLAGTDQAHSGSSGAHAQWWCTELTASLTTSTVCNIPAHPPSVVLALQQAHDLQFRDALARACATGWRGFYAGFAARTVAIAGTMTVVPLILARGKDVGLD